MKDVAAFLEEAYRRFHTLKEAEQDPVSFPRRFEDPADAEVVGIIAATLAFGRVASFMPVIATLVARIGPHPAHTLEQADRAACAAFASGVRHRWAGPGELEDLLFAVGTLLRRDRGLSRAFLAGYRSGEVYDGLASLSAALREAGPRVSRIVSSVGPNDPAKRLCMFLRWMVRKDEIDMGHWGSLVKPSALRIPLDVHVHRIARMVGLLPPVRSGPRRRDAIALTRTLASMDPEDPVRFDFALSHLGISGTCTGKLDAEGCRTCLLEPVCQVLQKRAVKD